MTVAEELLMAGEQEKETVPEFSIDSRDRPPGKV